MRYTELDTPSLLIDQDIMMANIEKMQKYADDQGVALRPHTKTHKAPYLAKLQRDAGCKGLQLRNWRSRGYGRKWLG